MTPRRAGVALAGLFLLWVFALPQPGTFGLDLGPPCGHAPHDGRGRGRQSTCEGGQSACRGGRGVLTGAGRGSELSASKSRVSAVPRVTVILTCIGIALTGVGVPTAGFGVFRHAVTRLEAAGQREPRSSLTTPGVSQPRDLLDRYCVTCHNERLQTAGLMLDVLDVQRPGEDAEVWEKVVRKLRSRTMPPPGRPRPDKPGYELLETWLETTLDRAAASSPNPGRPIIHRLNRTEYVNAVRDLLALEVDGRSLLPTDNSAHGFDNIGEALSFSPGLLDRYMSAARKISRRAIGDPTIRSIVETYRVSPLLVQNDRMSDDLPFGSRGGVAIRHHFPLDGEYVVRVRLQEELRDVNDPWTLRRTADRCPSGWCASQVSYRPQRGRLDEGPSKGPSVS